MIDAPADALALVGSYPIAEIVTTPSLHAG